MFTKLIAVVIAAGLVFGGAAATASAAQNSLPRDALYPIKTLSESVVLGLTPGDQAKLEKALEHVQRRVEEMAALSEMSEEVPQHLAEGYAERVVYALRLASKMSEAEMMPALAKIQASLQEQLGQVEQLQNARPEDVQLTRVATQLRQYLGVAALGLSNPQMFGENLAVLLQGSAGPSTMQEPSLTEEPSVTVTPAPGDDNSNEANANDSNTNSDDSNTNSDDANANGDDSNSNDDANANDDNGNDDDANGNDDDSNTNDDDGNSNDDDANGNDDDSNTNDDDANSNDDDGNSNDDDGNSNDDDDDDGNDDDGNSNDDDDANGNDDGGNSNDDDGNSNDDDNGNDDSAGVTSQGSGASSVLNAFYAFIAWIGSAVFSV